MVIEVKNYVLQLIESINMVDIENTEICTYEGIILIMLDNTEYSDRKRNMIIPLCCDILENK